MKSQIHLIRHGITEGNQRRLYYGGEDIPLAEEGVAELSKLAAEMIYPQAGSAAYYTSGMLRTEQTFELIFGEREHERIPELQEMRFGDFEMKSHEELKEVPEYLEWIGDKTGRLKSPGGESKLDFAGRISRGFEILQEKHRAFLEGFAENSGVPTDITAQTDDTAKGASDQEPASVVVCHGGVIAVIMMEHFAEEERLFYQWIPDPGHGYALFLEDERLTGYEAF